MTLEQIQKDIKEEKTMLAYYSAHNLWWTHLASDVEEATKTGRETMIATIKKRLADPDTSKAHKNLMKSHLANLEDENKPGIPTDPTGSPLMQISVSKWIDAAIEKPEHFGKHKIKAFIETHHQNGLGSLTKWNEVNDFIDMKEKLKK